MKSRTLLRLFKKLAVVLIVVVAALVVAPQMHAQRAGQSVVVPPEVAIPRPTADEIGLATESLKKYLASVDPATKAVLDKYPDLVSVRPPRENSAIVPSLAPFFRAKHQANLEVAKKGDINLLFIGDSITDNWRSATGNFAGKPVFDKYYGEMKAANFGIGGDTTQGVLYRLQNGEGQGFNPKAIMLMIGTNNTGRNSAAEIAEGIGAIVVEMCKDFTDAKILLLGIFPRGGAKDPVRSTISEINSKISKLHDGKHVFYLDIGAKFLDAEGSIPRDVMGDGLHPSTKGYEIWAEAVKEPLANLLKGQEAATAKSSRDPVTFTTQEDHRNMMEQLGITKLRPGPSGRENQPNPANYDEALANPFPHLPEVLKLNSGDSVTTPEQWWKQRRLEIVEDFDREVLGRVPANVPKVTWTVLETNENRVGDTDVIEKRLQGKVDNSACPSIEVNIAMTLVTPKTASKPVPVLMMFSGFGFGGGRGGPGAGGAPGGAGANAPQNARPAGEQQAAAPSTQPGKQPAPAGQTGSPGGGRGGFAAAGAARNQQLLDAGWGYAAISPASIQADNGAGLTRGIIGLTSLGQPRKPDDWGSLRAWAWGAARGLDYLETEPAVDAKRVGIEGVSRYGKAALVAMAFEPRFAMVLVGSSGEGGAKLHRRNFGEAVENLTGSGEYHWMAGNFLKYGTAESSFGSKNAGDIPVDAHQLIALCAPRLTFISYGVPEKGDAKWLDQQGSYMATVAAGPVFKLLGAKDLGTSNDYQSEKMPAVNGGLLDGQLAWRQHDGGHTDGPNIVHFTAWANKHFASALK